MSRYLTFCRWCGVIFAAERRTRTTCGPSCRQNFHRGEWHPKFHGPNGEYWLLQDALRWKRLLTWLCGYLDNPSLMTLLSPRQRELIKKQEEQWARYRSWNVFRNERIAKGDKRYVVNQAC